MLDYYYSFEGYYGEDKLDNGKIGIHNSIGRCPKTKMETKCQDKTHPHNQYVLIVQYFIVLFLVWSVSSFEGYYGGG